MKTEVIFVIDGSGSMGTKANDVRGGFNTYVDELRKNKKADYSLSAIVFNTSVFPLFSQKDLKDVPELTTQNYVPGGGTALYDAIGAALDEIKDVSTKFCSVCGTKRNNGHKFCAQCGGKLDNEKSTYLLIIMTDGEENSSKTYRKHHIAQKIKDKEAQGNWTVVYLGANQDAMAEGTAMGVQVGNTLTYDVTDTKTYYSKLASTTTAYQYASARGDDNPLLSVSNFAGVTATATPSGITESFVGISTGGAPKTINKRHFDRKEHNGKP
jgi:uncharacterized protein YegL